MKITKFLTLGLFFTGLAFSGTDHICEQGANIEVDDQGETKNLFDAGYCTKKINTLANGAKSTTYEATKKLSDLIPQNSPTKNPLEYFTTNTTFIDVCTEACENRLKNKLKAEISRITAGLSNSPNHVRSIDEITQEVTKLEDIAKENHRLIDKLDSQDVLSTSRFLRDNPLKGVSTDTQGNFVCEKVAKINCAQAEANYANYKINEYNKIEKAKSAQELEQKKLEARAANLNESLEKNYKGGFGPLAVKSLKDIDSAIDTNSSLKSICTERVTKNNKTPTDNKVIEACKYFKQKGNDVGEVYNRLQSIKDEIANSGSKLEVLGLKLDLSKLDKQQKDLALASLNEDVKGKLKGTILGNMLDQMREDMCNVAQNPASMCSGSSFGFEKFVNDSGQIINKEAAESAKEKFQGRAIGASKE